MEYCGNFVVGKFHSIIQVFPSSMWVCVIQMREGPHLLAIHERKEIKLRTSHSTR